VGPSGRLEARWDKQVLVPPAETLLWLDHWTAARRWIGGILHRKLHFYPFLVPGKGTVVASPAPGVPPVAVLICYEDIVPDLPRRFRDAGAGILLVLSNEVWFGEREFPQHLDMARVRAIETRTPVLRATNTGATAFIDPTGAVHAALPYGKPGFLVEQARMTTASPPPAWVPLAFRRGILAAAALLLLATFLPGHRRAAAREALPGSRQAP